LVVAAVAAAAAAVGRERGPAAASPPLPSRKNKTDSLYSSAVNKKTACIFLRAEHEAIGPFLCEPDAIRGSTTLAIISSIKKDIG
jgi:hypothetical protein